MNSTYSFRRHTWFRLFVLAILAGAAQQGFGQGRGPQRPPFGPMRPGMQPNLPPGPEEPPVMKMRLENQDLTAQIRNTPLQQVLEELAAWSGIVFEIGSDENPKVWVNFYRTSVEEAVERLIGNNNSILYCERDENGQSRVRFVRILGRAQRPGAPSLHYIGTGVVTKRGDDIVDSPEQALAVLAGSPNLVARQKAIEVLVASKGPQSIQALKAALADPAVEVKVGAIDGLASLGAREALPQIVLALKDAHPAVRQSAVLAVALLGDAANVKDLRPLVKDPDASVAASAEISIQKLSIRRP